MGCGLADRVPRVEELVRGMSSVLSCPLTVKMRMGKKRTSLTAHTALLPWLRDWGAAAATLHGRTKEQRYSQTADWEYIEQVAALASSVPLIGNGDIYTQSDAWRHLEARAAVAANADAEPDGGDPLLETVMLARGALIKPWLFTEIKERRDWDISASERFDIIKNFATFGLEHWGCDDQGVANTRKFLLEWMSFLHRYVPIGLMERPDLGAKLNLRPPTYYGRCELETLMGSESHEDWLELADRVLPLKLKPGTVDPLAHWRPSSISNAYAKTAVAGEGAEATQG